MVGPFQQEKARVGIGLVLTVVSISGLADIAGGAPRLNASAGKLAGAGGLGRHRHRWPPPRGISGWGASVVLIAVLILALVLFTGVTLRRAAAAVARAPDLWQALVPEIDEEAGAKVAPGGPTASGPASRPPNSSTWPWPR